MLLILYLRGLFTGDFRPALEDLLGEDASRLSSSTISRLCKEWESHHERFSKRHLGFSSLGSAVELALVVGRG